MIKYNGKKIPKNVICISFMELLNRPNCEEIPDEQEILECAYYIQEELENSELLKKFSQLNV